jgi:hypothetical protein
VVTAAASKRSDDDGKKRQIDQPFHRFLLDPRPCGPSWQFITTDLIRQQLLERAICVRDLAVGTFAGCSRQVGWSGHTDYRWRATSALPVVVNPTPVPLAIVVSSFTCIRLRKIGGSRILNQSDSSTRTTPCQVVERATKPKAAAPVSSPKRRGCCEQTS